jgi:hypothetical protein
MSTNLTPPRDVLNPIGRTWLALGIAFGLGALLSCPCGIGAGWWMGRGSVGKNDGGKSPLAEPHGPLATPVVGRWESVKIDDGADMELRKDGTGMYTGIQSEFKWRIEAEQNPVLVIDVPGQSLPCHFKVEGDTLTLTPLNSARPPMVLRRIK